jgi:TfoX/Sxy family transcriptional regulator of competence genes
MAWVRVPPENHPLFQAALPKDPRVETTKLFGGIAAKVNGNVFAGLFGLSTIVALDGDDKVEALSLEGASLFDPMGNGRVMSDKVMLPVRVMHDAKELRHWVARAFRTMAKLPEKAPKARARKAAMTAKASATRKATKTKAPAKRS